MSKGSLARSALGVLQANRVLQKESDRVALAVADIRHLLGLEHILTVARTDGPPSLF